MIDKSNSDWKCSIEGLYNSKGYTRDNCKLICVEFNSTDHCSMVKSEVTGSSQWSQEKIDYLKVHLMKSS